MDIKIYKIMFKIYKRGRFEKILNILGKEFVKINRNKIKLVIENKKYKVNEYIQLNNFKKSVLKIYIIFDNNISNTSCMFKNCESLLDFSLKDNIDNKEIINNYDIEDIEKDNNEIEDYINKINKDKGNIYYGLKDNIFCEYSEIKKIEESSKKTQNYDWEIFNVRISDISDTNDEVIINKCELLSCLTDISKWNFNNVTNISNMFNNCISLSSISGISKWNTDNAIE